MIGKSSLWFPCAAWEPDFPEANDIDLQPIRHPFPSFPKVEPVN